MPVLADDTKNFDHHSKDHRRDIEPVWRRFQAADRLPCSDAYGGFYIVARHGDLRQAAADWKTYSSAYGIALPDEDRSRHIPAEMDPPEQRDFRSLLMPFLGMNQVGAMEDMVRQRCTEQLDTFRDRNRLDFVEAFAKQFPIRVSLTLFGFPLEDAGKLDQMITTMLDHRGTPEGRTAAEDLTDYIVNFLKERARTAVSPEDDIISAVVLGEVGGKCLTLDEQLSITRLLLFGGFTTTTIALSESVRLFALHPEIYDRLKQEPDLIDDAIEELVRLASPATYLSRKVVQQATLGGADLSVGDRILLCFGAANRDPSVFEDPDEFRFDRKQNPHVAFGYGPHRCMGSLVAKLEMRVALEEFIKRFDRFEMDPEQAPEWENGETQGVKTLPLILHRTKR